MSYNFIIPPLSQNIVWANDYAVLDDTYINDSNNANKVLQIVNGALQWTSLSSLLSFTPLNRAELALWFDFADLSTITGNPTITAITDKSTHARNSVTVSGFTYATTYSSSVNTSIINLGAVSGGAGYFPSSTTDFTVIFALSFSTVPTTTASIWSNQVNGGNANFIYFDGVDKWRFVTSTKDGKFTFVPVINTTYLISISYSSTTNSGSVTMRGWGGAYAGALTDVSTTNSSMSGTWTNTKGGCVTGGITGQTEPAAKFYSFIIIDTTDIKTVAKYEAYINSHHSLSCLTSAHPYYYIDPINV
jgi:hypothetical protein